MLLKILDEEWEVPQYVLLLVEDMKGLSQMVQVQIQHIYREGNSLADCIANLAFDNTDRLVYNSFSELPNHA